MPTRGRERQLRAGGTAIEIGLNAAIVAVENVTPLILVIEAGARRRATACPSGRSIRSATGRWRSGSAPGWRRRRELKLGYVEQLYTFGDRGRHAEPSATAIRASCRSAISR